jgi:hypothetical protein
MSHLNEYRGHALVTNTSLGIGAAIASRLLYDDRHVTGLDRALSGAPYFASLTPDLLDADAIRNALVAIEVDPLRSCGRFHARRRTWQLRPCFRCGHVARKCSRSDATRQRLLRGGRIRADCDGNADAGRFGPGQRTTRLPRSAALSGPRKSLRPPRFCCPKRLPRSRANSS